MSERPSRIDFDLRTAYAGRMPEEQILPAKAEWNVQLTELRDELWRHFGGAAAAYRRRKNAEAMLACSPLSADPAAFAFLNFVPKSSAYDHDKLQFHLTRGDECVAECNLLAVKKNEWVLRHRLVHPAYRGKKIFSAMMDGMEAFVQAYADAEQSLQVVWANIGQPAVMARLYNKGYRPQNCEEEELFWNAIDGHPDYVCAYGFDDEMRAAFDDPDITEDVYCFDAQTVDAFLKSNAVRVMLQKSFDPQLQIVDTHKEETRMRMVKHVQ